MEMASTCSIDRVLHDLELLLNSLRDRYVPYDARVLVKHMKFLKTFLMCARKWSQSNDLYMESDNVVKKVSHPSFLSCIEDTFHKYKEDIHSLSLRLETTENVISTLRCGLFPEFEKLIKPFKQEIIQIYFALASSRSVQSNSCMTDDELVEFIDLILENLADLTTGYMHPKASESSICATLNAQVQALEVKLTFLKSFIPFAKLRGTIDIPPLLSAHFEVVALKVAHLSFMCSYWDDAEEIHNPEFCSMVYEQQQKVRAVDFHVYEIYMEVLRATKSSKSLSSTIVNKQILTDFNDSLISYLWELLCYRSSFMGFMRDGMQILYAGLRFLRSILREHQEKMDEQNEKLGALLSEAGIIIFSPSLTKVIEGEVSFLESTKAHNFRDMLANTNIHLKHVKDQISGSSTIESLPYSSHSLRVQEVCKPSRHIPRKGKIPIANEVIIGLDDEAEKVIDRLVSGPEQVEIVPIVGMAGLGKTTLAKKVYNDNSIICNFHIRLWCTISLEFNMKSLITQILFADGKYSRMDDMNEHELLQKLYQRLRRNRYLVVLDDVWDFRAWNELRYSFPEDKNRSRILFTSRFSNVALQVQYGGEPHYLRPLSEKESFELLQKKVFGKEDCPQALSGFGMEIAKKCRGLPLAIVVVAGVLATIDHDILVWQEFAKCLTSTMLSGTDQCKKSLELSYEHLPYHLKACLLYFAAFQEDEKIGAKNLIRLWIAEGFVEKIEGRRPEDVAEEYLIDLIGRNLVMASRSRSIGGVKTCYLHDLIFEFCKAEAKAKNFLQVLRGYDELSTFNGPPNLPRLSICSSGEDFIKSRLFCPHLGSLLLFGMDQGNCHWLSISFLFCIYKHLKVLKLDDIYLELEELPTEVESLLCLRYVALKALQMTFIPPSIAKLSHLETFSLISMETVSLPNSIWNMKKLGCLNVWAGSFIFPLSSNDNIVENHLSTLPNLDTLSGLYLSFDQGENLWRRIPNIRRLHISNGETGNGVCNMSRLECLESLTLDVGCCSGPRGHFELSFPMNLRKLTLYCLALPWSEMSVVEQLPNLEVLKLGCYAFEGKRWELIEGGFQKLRVLTLSELDGIVEWTETDPDSDVYFLCLQQLILRSIRNLKMIPSCLGRISTLEMIKVKHCGHDVESLVWEIEEAQKNYGNENLKIIIID